MISPITSGVETTPLAPSTPASSNPKPSAATSAQADSVQLSSAALNVLKEASETPAQTAKEAASGDSQAKRLLAKEAAESAVQK